MPSIYALNLERLYVLPPFEVNQIRVNVLPGLLFSAVSLN